MNSGHTAWNTLNKFRNVLGGLIDWKFGLPDDLRIQIPWGLVAAEELVIVINEIKDYETRLTIYHKQKVQDHIPRSLNLILHLGDV